jgi:xylulokinase
VSLFVGHDLGTQGNKAVLVEADGSLIATATASFGLDRPAPDRAEQDPASWWDAVCSCTRELLAKSGRSAADVRGIAFAGQMLSLVALDAECRPVLPAISWLDARAHAQATRLTRRLGGNAIVRLIAGAAPTAKDIIPKVWWIREQAPDAFARVAAITDATGYLVARATGRASIDPTGAAATGIIDGNSRSWSKLLSFAASYPIDRTPPIVECTATVAGLRPDAAAELGLTAGTPVVAGLADIPAAAVGSGAVRPGDSHVYLGTSGWFAAMLDRARHVPRAGIVAVAGPAPGTHLLIGENETAGACVAWFAREFVSATDDIDAHEQIDALVARSTPGANGLLFAPWLFGERSPVPDHSLRAAFVGLSLDHTRADLARAVYEGVALNLAWTREAARAAGVTATTVRAIGGGARSRAWLQIVADATGARVEAVANPQHAGAIGAALVAAVGAGEVASVAAIRDRVRVAHTFEPDAQRHALYADHLDALRSVYPAVSRVSSALQKHRVDHSAGPHAPSAT